MGMLILLFLLTIDGTKYLGVRVVSYQVTTIVEAVQKPSKTKDTQIFWYSYSALLFPFEHLHFQVPYRQDITNF